MTDKHTDETQRDEHARIGGVDGKKVFILDDAGNQIISFSSATVSILAPSYYQGASLVSGYVFHGFTTPSNNPTTSTFRLLRETLDTGEVLFGGGSPNFTHQWSSSSLASISWS